MTRRLVLIRWVDSANLFGDRWATEDDLDQHAEQTFCETAGWIIRKNDHSVFVASSLTPTKVGSVMQIPKVAVVDRYTLGRTVDV